MDWLSWLTRQQQAGKLRHLEPLQRRVDGQVSRPADGQPVLDFSSNDYLGLSCHPEVIAASQQALQSHGAGAGAARLMSGDLPLHHELEEAIAAYKNKEAALIFGSGYQANATIIPALMGRHDVIFSDRLNHASIVDGCQLAGSKLHRFRHNDLNHLEELLHHKRGSQEALIVVESIYSMDGDLAPLQGLVELKERYGCLLMVDEAHATGLFGSQGSGLVEQAGCTDQVELIMGTFGKALGSFGAYIAADQTLINYLINRARGFIYSTALPPAVSAASLAALQLCQQQPPLREQLWHKVNFFLKKCQELGLPCTSASQIFPLRIGASEASVQLAQALRQKNIFATAVRPPTVPENTARLRFSITNHLSEDELDHGAQLLAELWHG